MLPPLKKPYQVSFSSKATTFQSLPGLLQTELIRPLSMLSQVLGFCCFVLLLFFFSILSSKEDMTHAQVLLWHF